mmetsp:Transcript_51277/g.58753  ORF Transcript_51277/g.58753 Transcript_51277/m.58753 type:complete len:483 (+) Transcript_51277:45-1493(+)
MEKRSTFFPCLLATSMLLTSITSRIVLPSHHYPYNGPLNRSPFLDSTNLTSREDHPKIKLVPEFSPQVVYSGFVEFEQYSGSAIYFNFYQALEVEDSEEVPILVWLQGGPGCSSWLANLVEFGPYEVVKSPGDCQKEDKCARDIKFGDNFFLKRRPNSWNEKYHLIFIDNPFGSGYSYAINEHDYVSTEEQVSQIVSSTLLEFTTQFPQYQQNPLFITGESYGGHYVPAVAEYILNNSIQLNLKGVAIGDGWTDPEIQIQTFSLFAIANALIDFEQLPTLKTMESNAAELVKNGKSQEAVKAFENILSYICESAGGIRDINYREFGACNKVPPDMSSEFLNDSQVKSILGVPSDVTYTECNSAPFNHLIDDYIKSYKSAVASTLDHIPVLLYNGQNDLGINLVSSQAWIRSLNWQHIQGFLQTKKTEFYTQGQSIAGYIRSYHNLSQAIVLNAGHEVPKDQLERSVALLDVFIQETLKGKRQ